MKFNLKTWWWSVRKNNQWVVKLAVALVLVGLAFSLLSSRPIQYSNITETPFLETSQAQSSLNVPGLNDQFHQKGTKVLSFTYGIFILLLLV